MSGSRARKQRIIPGSPEWQANVDRYIGEVADLIARHGHAVQGVFGDVPADTFSYTVGLTEDGRPELWIGSLSPTQAHPILNRLAAIKQTPPAEVDCGYSTQFRLRGPVDPDAAEVGVARRLYGDHPDAVAVTQVLWPDDAGKYPDEDGYDAVRFPQRVLPLVTA